MRFSDIRIGSRLAIGFGSILALMIIIVLFDFFYIRRQHELFTRIVDTDTAKFELVAGMQNALQRKAIKLHNSIILNDHPEIEMTLSSAESDTKIFIQLSKQLESLLNAEEKPQFEKISEIHKTLTPLLEGLSPLITANRDTEAHRLLLAKYMPLQKNLLRLLDNFSANIKNRQKRDKTVEERFMRVSLSMGLFLGLMSIILGIMFALVTTRSITEPVLILENEAKKLETGDYNLILPTERKDELGTLATTLKHSIDELHKYTEIEKDYMFQLMNSEKLASIGEFASGIVHNLKTPLNAILWLAEILHQKRPDDIQHVEQILSAGRTMEKIIENILYKTRQEQSAQEKSVDINSVLRHCLYFLEANPFFKHKAQRNIELKDSLPKLTGVYSTFSQSFNNIINNALDAMYNSDAKILTVKTWHDEKNIYVLVGDTGEGIAENRMKLIFEPHFTTKSNLADAGENEPVGTGLGLYMVRELLKKHHAEYDIKSQIGKGTIFTVMFPLDEQKCLS